jgi:hypothetical protein
MEVYTPLPIRSEKLLAQKFGVAARQVLSRER